MTGTIIDAETKAPIEGAVVLVEWTKVKGIGFTYTESYKVAETISDKDGKFHLPGCICVGTDEPDVTIYKKGYVAWNNKYTFPNYVKRNGVSWGDISILLNKYDEHMLHSDHIMFIRSRINTSINFGAKQMFFKKLEDERLRAK